MKKTINSRRKFLATTLSGLAGAAVLPTVLSNGARAETEKKEYIYPLITSREPKKPIKKTYIILLGV